MPFARLYCLYIYLHCQRNYKCFTCKKKTGSNTGQTLGVDNNQWGDCRLLAPWGLLYSLQKHKPCRMLVARPEQAKTTRRRQRQGRSSQRGSVGRTWQTGESASVQKAWNMDAKFLLYEAPENILKNMLTVNTALNIFKCAERKSNSNDVLFTTKTQEV